MRKKVFVNFIAIAIIIKKLCCLARLHFSRQREKKLHPIYSEWIKSISEFSRWEIRKNISTLLSFPIINKRRMRILQKEYIDIFRMSNSLTYGNDQLCFAIPIPPVFFASFRNNPIYPNNYVSSFLDGIQNVNTIQEMVVHLRISRFIW